MSKTGSYTSLFKVISYADLKTGYKILEMIEEIDARNGNARTKCFASARYLPRSRETDSSTGVMMNSTPTTLPSCRHK